MESKTEAYSFKQLCHIKRKDYFETKDSNKKEKIISIFICDQQVSNDFLNILSNRERTKELANTFEMYFDILKYSLNAEENLKHYEFLKALCHQLNYNINLEKFEYLSQNDPINNFKKIADCYSNIENLKDTSDNNVKKIIDNIDESINKINKAYNVKLKEYYFPPSKEHPTYAYNYYSYKILNIFKKLQKVKIVKKFHSSNDTFQPNNISSKRILYKHLNYILVRVAPLFKKFSYENIEHDLIVLNIVTLYLTILEKSRNDYEIMGQVNEVFESLNSTPITSDILKEFEIYREGCDIPVNPEEWDSIGLNEDVYIKKFEMLKTQIKRYNNNILKLDETGLEMILTSPKISYLNMDGLINYGLIKMNKEIEDYSITLLRKIFSSKLYINNFIKYDKRFSSEKEKMLNSIFYGANKDEIFRELWKSIIFIPLIKQRLSGFNNRSQYSIFINSEHNFNMGNKFNKVIPRFHCEINSVYHEITHNLSLLLAANLEENNFETIIIDNNHDLNELQRKYCNEYSQNSMEFDKFEDFGDLMEVVLYGIRPRIFRTFSSLFCLNLDSYNIDMNENIFRDTCLNLYQSKIKIEKNLFDKILSGADTNEILKDNENQNKKNMKIIINLLKSRISKLLSKSFIISNTINNESFIEDENARSFSNNYIFNDDYIIEIDYCDKLD